MTIDGRVDVNGSGRTVTRVAGLLTGIVLVSALAAVAPGWASARGQQPPAPSAACRLTKAIRPGAMASGCRPAATTTAIDFNDVAATSNSSAWIVGESHAGRNPVRTLTVHWNGRTWQRVPSPNASGRRTSSFLNAIAATSSSNAWAVGESNVKNLSTLIEQWNGKSWKLVPSPTPNPKRDFSFLEDVAARTRTDAWAVGFVIVGPGSNSRTLIEHWNGTSWQQVPSPSITNGHGDQVQNGLGGVTVISPANAWAVGDYIIGSDPPQTLIEHWNGKKWSIVPSPDPDGTASPASLGDIAAISRTDMFAVGALGDVFAPTQTLIARWNGATWQTVPSPFADTATESLGGVAAVSATDAWAVGAYDTQTTAANLTLIVRWNGKKWHTVRAPFPHGAIDDSLGAVATVGAKSAWAVGSVSFASSAQPLVLRWNGTKWTIVTVSLKLARHPA